MKEVAPIDPKRASSCRDGTESTTTISSSPRARGTRTSTTRSGKSLAPGPQEHRRRDRAAPPVAPRVRARRATDDDADRAAWLTFVIVGGGPTGVELAGMLPTIARFALPHGLPSHRSDEGADDSRRGRAEDLPAYPDALTAHARRDLANLGVDVRIGERVRTSVMHSWNSTVNASTRTRSSGRRATRRAGLAATFDATHDRAGRVRVLDDLSVPGHPEVFVVGDLAVLTKSRCRCRPSRRRRCRWADRGAQYSSHRARRGTRKIPLSEQGRPRDDRPLPRHRGLRPGVTRAAGSHGGSGCSSTSCIWPASATG